MHLENEEVAIHKMLKFFIKNTVELSKLFE